MSNTSFSATPLATVWQSVAVLCQLIRHDVQKVTSAPVLSLVLAGGDLLQEICHALPLGALEPQGLKEWQNLRASALCVNQASSCAGLAYRVCATSFSKVAHLISFPVENDETLQNQYPKSQLTSGCGIFCASSQLDATCVNGRLLRTSAMRMMSSKRS